MRFRLRYPADAYARYYAGTKNDLVHETVGPTDFTSAQVPAFAAMLDGAEPLDVLDYGCGSGALLAHLAQLHPQHRYLGFDVNAEVGDAAPAGIAFTRDEPQSQKFDLIILPALETLAVRHGLRVARYG